MISSESLTGRSNKQNGTRISILSTRDGLPSTGGYHLSIEVLRSTWECGVRLRCRLSIWEGPGQVHLVAPRRLSVASSAAPPLFVAFGTASERKTRVLTLPLLLGNRPTLNQRRQCGQRSELWLSHS